MPFDILIRITMDGSPPANCGAGSTGSASLLRTWRPSTHWCGRFRKRVMTLMVTFRWQISRLHSISQTASIRPQKAYLKMLWHVPCRDRFATFTK